MRRDTDFTGSLLDFIDLYVGQAPDQRKVVVRLRALAPDSLPPSPRTLVFSAFNGGKSGADFSPATLGLQERLSYFAEAPEDVLKFACEDEGLDFSVTAPNTVTIRSPELYGQYHQLMRVVFRVPNGALFPQDGQIPDRLAAGGRSMAMSATGEYLAVVTDFESVDMLAKILHISGLGELAWKQDFEVDL